jgi:hypothetical protein
MGFEVTKELKPSYSKAAATVLLLLAVLLFGMVVAFAYLLIFGKGNDYVLGALLAFEFLIAGIEVLLYGRYFVSFREVSEDRGEELLW